MAAVEGSPNHPALTADVEPAVFIAGIRAADLEEAIELLADYPRTGFVLFPTSGTAVEPDPAALLVPHPPLPIVMAQDGMRILADRIHLAPACGQLDIEDGVLRIAAGPPQTDDDPYDRFLRALAKSEGPRALTFARIGSEDGPGARAVREAGGRVVSGRPIMASFAAEGLARALDKRAMPIVHPPPPQAATRLALPKVGAGLPWAAPDQPSHHLLPMPKEAPDQLPRRDAGGFFREAAALSDLQERFLLPLAADRAAAGEQIRLWVLGCGTGEEAYTAAMLAADTLARSDAGLALKVFAVDADEWAVEEARRGVYPGRIEQDVPARYLARYFIQDETGWRVTPELRASLVFGRYNSWAPPLSRMDLVLCRDMLSSRPADERSRLLVSFRFALRPGGLLLLGPTDQVTRIAGFETIAATPGLFRRNGSATEAPEPPPLDSVAAQGGPSSHALDLEIAAQAATDAFVPPSVLIDGSGRIFATLGPVDRFLNMGAGSSRLLAASAPWLRRGLAHAMAEARRSGDTASFRAMAALGETGGGMVTLRVQPVQHERAGLLLVSFLSPGFSEGTRGDLVDRAQHDRLMALEEENGALQREVDAARLELAARQQQFSLRLEEEQSIQEELSAGTDELRSQVRKLECAVAELRKDAWRNQELAGDLQNIMASSGTACLLLDAGLGIRFFTPSDQLPFHLIASDIGRPLADIAPLVPDPDLLNDARLVLGTGQPASRELEGPGGAWLMRRIHPYLEREVTAGVVITYADIRDAKAAAAEAEATRDIAVDLIRAHPQPLILLDANLQVIFVNDPFREIFGGDGNEAGLRMLIGAALRAAPELSTFLTSRDDRARRIDDCVIQVSLPAHGARTLRLVASRVPPGRTLLGVDDITERVLLTASLERAKAGAERASRDKSRLLAAASQELRQSLQSFEAFYRAQVEWENEAGLPRHMKRLGFAIGEMAGVLDALQDGAQLDMGTLEFTTSAFPVGSVLAGIDADFAASARLRGIRWRVVGCGRVIFSDPRILRRALRHVVSVLLRYTPVTRILIGCRPRGTGLRIEIRTQGLQLPLPTFRAGFEAHHDGGVRGEGSEGMRLGLDVARRLGEFLGHVIRIDARSPGQAVFLTDVPTADGSASAVARAVRDGMSHVLIIEEDVELTVALRLLLERDGYAVMTSTDAAHALSLALEHPPALIITDYDLPGSMTGLDLARRMAGRREPPPAAILLTDGLGAGALGDIAAAGFDHAPRTADAGELLGQVRRLLPRATGAATLPATVPGRIFLLDDDPERRLRLRDWLGSQGWVAEEFATVEGFLEADTPERRGCVLADWSTAETRGRTLLAALRPLAHRLPVIALADQGDIHLAVTAISAGAIDFIKRPIQRDMLVRSLGKATAQVAEGEQQQASKAEQAARLASLTPRQREILERILAGAPNKIIAADLNLSQRTVENHRATLMAKLGARSLPELIRIVMGAR
ncbi:response regulator [Roseococcus sp. SYP-B2431]|uniref:CheR family methyltransferase n=1 Tax=Roseococcus sp. SYP-B2431 TaxID=2496640 RepID=UPI00103EEB90|nr:CheR family methyltransferase [Roseococcus sp. SYP-B2431]TCH96310.1 response regulator [Roseococcus sp. SYP-B2431]